MSVIDVENWLQEISPEAPSGKDLEYDPAFMALVEKTKGTPEQQLGDRIEPAIPPNWKEVCNDSLALLATTHDLRLGIYLTQALLHTDGYAGLADGLALLAGLVEKFWDSAHPQLDPEDNNDPTQRINILSGLCDFENLLYPLLLAPLVESSAMGRFSLRDINIAMGKMPPPSTGEAPQPAAIQGALSEAPIESLQGTMGAIAASLDSLGSIESRLTDRVGVENAPSFAPLHDLLRDARHILEEPLARRGASAAVATGESEGEVGIAPAAEGRAIGAAAPSVIRNREDVIRTLDSICEYYSRFEPSSPVPLLLKRARRLVSKDFMEIMTDLAPDGLNQIKFIKGLESDEGK